MISTSFKQLPKDIQFQIIIYLKLPQIWYFHKSQKKSSIIFCKRYQKYWKQKFFRRWQLPRYININNWFVAFIKMKYQLCFDCQTSTKFINYFFGIPICWDCHKNNKIFTLITYNYGMYKYILRDLRPLRDFQWVSINFYREKDMLDGDCDLNEEYEYLGLYLEKDFKNICSERLRKQDIIKKKWRKEELRKIWSQEKLKKIGITFFDFYNNKLIKKYLNGYNNNLPPTYLVSIIKEEKFFKELKEKTKWKASYAWDIYDTI